MKFAQSSQATPEWQIFRPVKFDQFLDFLVLVVTCRVFSLVLSSSMMSTIFPGTCISWGKRRSICKKRNNGKKSKFFTFAWYFSPEKPVPFVPSIRFGAPTLVGVVSMPGTWRRPPSSVENDHYHISLKI
ncbi:hypothetical protein K458DRAFT_396209 [Lentithecium fluviatile CBS 122367]|uniref:Uncharacterized protein n=1 Tax=Lentithecium fluviatile CBS 122367 TaxID=1168545 RepID=A0A6G1IGB0_9PLEO|nr:hypothetical protein K458DRAFT_396209 [Lentithecium fluviatile CBS 122367]